MLIKIVNFVLFQATWLACVLGAARDNPWLGPAVAAGMVLVDLALHARPAAQLRLVALCTMLGAILDSTVAAAGVLTFHANTAPVWLCPWWIMALWLAFSSTLSVSLSWIQHRPLIAAGFGGLGGPLAYLAGARLGALSFDLPQGQALVWVGLEWAGAMTLFSWLAPTLIGSSTDANSIPQDPDLVEGS